MFGLLPAVFLPILHKDPKIPQGQLIYNLTALTKILFISYKCTAGDRLSLKFYFLEVRLCMFHIYILHLLLLNFLKLFLCGRCYHCCVFCSFLQLNENSQSTLIT